VLRQDLSSRSLELRATRVPFVHARVVLAERPTSAKPGDEAIVLADGTVEGFVGGSCAEGTVRTEALALLGVLDVAAVGGLEGTGSPGPVGGALASAPEQTLLLRVSPEPEGAQPGKRVVHNPCLSGGTLEIFLEAVVPPPLVAVAGHAPIARAMASLAAALRWDTADVAESGVPADATAVVVASHGRGEEEVLAAALAAGVPYIGLVASARRGTAVLDALDLAADQRARVHTPAGLDLGPGTPEEAALSILAEIVALRPRPVVSRAAPASPPQVELDPVCGMVVSPDAGGLSLEAGGRRVWFCGRGCRDAFAASPGAYTGR
jgi:xanthine dehydrogenase accessory factor